MLGHTLIFALALQPRTCIAGGLCAVASDLAVTAVDTGHGNAAAEFVVALAAAAVAAVREGLVAMRGIEAWHDLLRLDITLR